MWVLLQSLRGVQEVPTEFDPSVTRHLDAILRDGTGSTLMTDLMVRRDWCANERFQCQRCGESVANSKTPAPPLPTSALCSWATRNLRTCVRKLYVVTVSTTTVLVSIACVRLRAV